MALVLFCLLISSCASWETAFGVEVETLAGAAAGDSPISARAADVAQRADDGGDGRAYDDDAVGGEGQPGDAASAIEDEGDASSGASQDEATPFVEDVRDGEGQVAGDGVDDGVAGDDESGEDAGEASPDAPDDSDPLPDGWTQADGGWRYGRGGRALEGWLVTDDHPILAGLGLERYWLGAGGWLATARLVTPDEGAGWWAYATPWGAVVRGAWDTGEGLVYLADNDGRLPEATGWLVTGGYAQGELQRYYLDEWSHAARSGFFEVDGSHYYGLADRGCVLRGKLAYGEGSLLLADNDGRFPEQPGWLVSALYDEGLERYWLEEMGTPEGHLAARTGLFELDGEFFYGRPDAGFVVRGAWDTGAGRIYVADNEGLLPQGDGWLVTGIYTRGALERYRVDGRAHAVLSGFFEVDGAHYFGVGGAGYVLRGKMAFGDHVLVADNDGKFPEQYGWVVTGIYDGGRLERYWMDAVLPTLVEYQSARIGWFDVEGSRHYGLPDRGYVLRGVLFNPDGSIILADNQGRIAELSSFVPKADAIPYEMGMRFFGMGEGFALSEGAYDELIWAMRQFWDAGQIAGFVVMDLASGAGMTWDTASERYAASCMKAAYLTWICAERLDTGAVGLDSVAYQMEQTGVMSNNDTYHALRYRFGDAGFDNWLAASGLPRFGNAWYPFTNARDLARIWAKIAEYQLSSAPHAWYCREILSHGYYSEIYYNLGGGSTTYSKPGWINSPPTHVGFNDSGVIIDSNGRAYLMTVMTTANCWTQQYKLANLVRALDRIHGELPW